MELAATVQAHWEPLVTHDEMAAILAVSPRTFYRMRRDARENGNPCPEITWGRRLLRYRASEVLRWAAALEG